MKPALSFRAAPSGAAPSRWPGTRARPRRRTAVEWPTWGLVAAIYGGWMAVTWWHASLPAWAIVPLGAWLLAWHGSLQHECLHGHPTRWRRLNFAIAWWPIALWLPYERYRFLHLRHHRDWALTSPLDDPESFYLAPQVWSRLGRAGRLARRAFNTVAGRLLLGPVWLPLAFWRHELRQIAAGDRGLAQVWVGHLAGVALVLAWVVGACGMGLGAYVLLMVLPGLALALLRSYAEHRWAEAPGHRTVIVEGSPLLALLYLNNTLHAVHHAKPRLPWYRLPAAYRAAREEWLAANGGYLQRGYAGLFRRHLLAAKEPVVHPAAPDGRIRPPEGRPGAAPSRAA